MYHGPDNTVFTLRSSPVEAHNNLGVGWNTGMPYIFADTSTDNYILYLFSGGSVYEIDQAGVAYKRPGESNLLWYDLDNMTIYMDNGAAYNNFKTYQLTDLQIEYGIADTPGDESMYVLVCKDNSKYWFPEDGRLLME
jgi:hypothetical protein